MPAHLALPCRCGSDPWATVPATIHDVSRPFFVRKTGRFLHLAQKASFLAHSLPI